MPENLAELILQLASAVAENECLEFKHGNTDPDRIGRDISALANSAALLGHVYAYKIWGIDDHTHEIIGTDFNPKTTKVGNQELELWLRQHVSDNAEFQFSDVEVHDKRTVLLRIWPAQYRPVLFKGITYIRTGSSTQELKHGSRREEELWRRTKTEVFELQSAAAALTVEEIFSRLNIEQYRQSLDVPASTSNATLVDYLAQEQIICLRDDGKYDITNLGALLFARDLNTFPSISRKALRVIKYDGDSPIAPSRSKTFTLGYAHLDDMLAYIEALLPASEYIDGATRKTDTAYPHIALRELTANMLIHQDLSVTGAGPMINIFDNSIEFTNPGRSLIDVAQLLNAPPRSRNERLAALTRRMGLCEEAGTGWDKIVMACETRHLPAPEARESGDNMIVTLLRETSYKTLTTQQRIDAAYWHACLQLRMRKPMTNLTLRERFGLPSSSSAQISRLLKECLNRGILVVADPDTGPKYMRYLPYWAK